MPFRYFGLFFGRRITDDERRAGDDVGVAGDVAFVRFSRETPEAGRRALS